MEKNTTNRRIPIVVAALVGTALLIASKVAQAIQDRPINWRAAMVILAVSIAAATLIGALIFRLI